MFSVDTVTRFPESDGNVVLGPGSYNPGEYGGFGNAKPTTSGFGHAQRVFSGNSALLDGPSPAEYIVKDDRMCSNVPVQAASGPMRSKTAGRQDKRRIEDSPGPGAYLRMDVDFKRRPQAPPPPPAVSWERVPTAPSIPGHHQSFGYEEGPDGELVQQMRVDEGYDGTKMSMPGPSDYRPRHVKGRHVPKADLARTSGHSTFERPVEIVPAFNPYEHPKPTEYVQRPHSPGTRDGKPRKSAAFASGVGRNSIDGDLGAGLKKPSPGPGTYEIAASDASQAPGRKGTYFSHGGSRFDNSFSGGRYTSPGPGQYVGQTTAFEQRTRRRSRHLGPARTGFGCGGRTDWTRGSHGAGPGAYEPANGVIDEMRRRVSSRTGAFGTSQTRFQVSKERKRDVPDVHGRTMVEIPGNRKRGPSLGLWFRGQPRQMKGPLPRQCRQCTAAFASGAPRGLDYGRDGPAPTAYHVKGIDWNASGTAKLHGGGRRKDRDNGVPGPGSFNLAHDYHIEPNRKRVMVVSAERFGPGGPLYQHPDVPDEPGPGNYDYEMPFGNLLKPTYNVAIAEQCRELVF